ncbi:MAG: HDOD domain-containing protein [Gammaproteobacteria bacterium]|nr:HDOD domain-containing protein [Gammaproteobacteria bacterium]
MSVPIAVTELIKGVDNLVSFLDVADHDDGARAHIKQHRFEALHDLARLLRVANSSAYGLSSKVDSVVRAASVIGTARLRDLVLATSTVSAFEGIPNTLVTMDNFWRHSLYCAVAARVLAERFHKRSADTLFIAGLLHDIGQLLIFNQRPQQAKEALLKALDGSDDLPMHEAERAVLGFDHAQVGGELLRHWNFPDVLAECVEFHHAPKQAKKFPEEVAFIDVANTIAALAEVASVEAEDVPASQRDDWAIIGFTADMIVPTVHATREKFDEVKDLFKT